MLSEADHKKIAAAIEEVERKTSGDLFCIVTDEASHYREVPLAWASLVALLVPPLALMAGLSPLVVARAFEGWQSVQAAAQSREIVLALTLYAVVQAVLFALTAFVVSIPAVRRLMTPHFLKRHRTSRLARQHFASTGLHLVPGQPHVLIFLALKERRVEILAESAVHSVAGQQVWDDARGAIVEGMRGPDPSDGIVRAIAIAGAALAKHFPAKRDGAISEGVAEI